MKKKEFLNELEKRLSRLSKDEISNTLSYYSEIIDEKIDAGIDEETAVASLGSVDDIAREIPCDLPVAQAVKEKIKNEKSLAWWHIVLIIVGFPIWFSLLAATAAVIISVIAAIAAAIISFYAVGGALAIAGAAGFFTSFYVIAVDFARGALLFGYSAASLGVGILVTIGTVELTKLLVKLSKWTVYTIKKAFIRKEKI